MNDPGPVDHVTAGEARVAGVCYLLVIAGGIFAALFARESLFVSGDAAATARNIAGNQNLWRWGIAVHLLYLLPAAAANVILYRIFKPTHATLALLALVFGIADVAIEALLLAGLHVPLTTMREAGVFGVLGDAQKHALGYLGVRLFFIGWGFALLLFSGFCAIIGILILRSKLIPRIVGVLMIAAGVSYFVNSLSGIVAPGFANSLLPFILLPAFLGELTLALWLTVRGVNVRAAMGYQNRMGDHR